MFCADAGFEEVPVDELEEPAAPGAGGCCVWTTTGKSETYSRREGDDTMYSLSILNAIFFHCFVIPVYVSTCIFKESGDNT